MPLLLPATNIAGDASAGANDAAEEEEEEDDVAGEEETSEGDDRTEVGVKNWSLELGDDEGEDEEKDREGEGEEETEDDDEAALEALAAKRMSEVTAAGTARVLVDATGG